MSTTERRGRPASARRTGGAPPRDGGAAEGNLPAVLAGVTTAVVGFAGSFALVLSGLRSVGADQQQAVSGLLLLCVAMGALSIWFGLRWRIPVSIAWSTPGAALLMASGPQPGGYGAAVGAFLLAGLLVLLAGLVGPLARLLAAIPQSTASALLAGILFPMCVAPVRAVAAMPGLALPVVAVWALLTRFVRPWAVPGALVATVTLLLLRSPSGSLGGHALLPTVRWTTPVFAPGAVIGLAVPLFVVTMASQNLPGLAALRQYGYRLSAGRVLAATGAATVLLAPGGGFMFNLAASTAALVAGPDAHPDRSRRWVASVTAACVYLGFGLGAGVFTRLLLLAPPLLFETVAGLALLGTFRLALGGALGAADGDARPPRSPFSGPVTFLVTASGVSFFGIGSPLWGLLAGLAATWLTDGHMRPVRADSGCK